MKSKYFLFGIMFLLFLIPFSSAVPPVSTAFQTNTGLDVQANFQQYYKINEPAEIHIYVFNISDGSQVNSPDVTCKAELSDRNGTTLVFADASVHNGHFVMARNGSVVTETGVYAVTLVCNTSLIAGYKTAFFEATESGIVEPEGSLVIFFSILFLIFIGGFISLLLYTIFHLIEWTFDAKDLTINVSAYFVLFASYILGNTYLKNTFISDMYLWLIGVGALTMVILPIIAFFISYVKGGLKHNE